MDHNIKTNEWACSEIKIMCESLFNEYGYLFIYEILKYYEYYYIDCLQVLNEIKKNIEDNLKKEKCVRILNMTVDMLKNGIMVKDDIPLNTRAELIEFLD